MCYIKNDIVCCSDSGSDEEDDNIDFEGKSFEIFDMEREGIPNIEDLFADEHIGTDSGGVPLLCLIGGHFPHFSGLVWI